MTTTAMNSNGGGWYTACDDCQEIVRIKRLKNTEKNIYDAVFFLF